MSEKEKVQQQMQEDVAAYVRAARAFRHLSEKELADKAGISRSRLSLIENAKTNVRIETLAKIMAVLGFRWVFGFIKAQKEHEKGESTLQ